MSNILCDDMIGSLRCLSNCLNKDGEWQFEPPPSMRESKFYLKCRFDSLDEAINIYNKRNEK